MSERAIMSALSYKPAVMVKTRNAGSAARIRRTLYGTVVAVNFTNGSLVLLFGGSEKNA